MQCAPDTHGGQRDIGTKVRSSRAEDVVGLLLCPQTDRTGSFPTHVLIDIKDEMTCGGHNFTISYYTILLGL